MNNNGAPNPRNRAIAMASLRAVVAGYLVYLCENLEKLDMSAPGWDFTAAGLGREHLIAAVAGCVSQTYDVTALL